MIARFRILLPFTLSIPCYDELQEMHFQHDEYEVTVFPPMRANVDASVCDITSTAPIIDAISKLESEKILSVTSSIKINGQETIQANLLQIDLLAKREFDRRKDKLVFDPQIGLLFALTNSVIGKLRSVGRLSQTRYLYPDNVPGWKVEYLDDEGRQLPKDPALRRSHFISSTKTEISGVTGEIWKLALTLPIDYIPSVWDMLILDARAQVTDANAAIVLANAALESFINLSLDILAKESSLPEQTWKWIIARNENWLKQPSAKEKYDEVLFVVTGRSLKKEDTDLWKAYEELRSVRNSIVHQGRAVLTRRTNKKKRLIETEVTSEMAGEMIGNAEKIIAWIESILPDDKRRVLFTGQTTFEFNRSMTGADNTETELWGVQAKGARVKLTPDR